MAFSAPFRADHPTTKNKTAAMAPMSQNLIYRPFPGRVPCLPPRGPFLHPPADQLAHKKCGTAGQPLRSGSLWRTYEGWATFGTMEAEVDLPLDAFLEVMKKDGETFRFPITKKTVTIGRDPACDLYLDDPYVSRKHCQVVFRGEHFTVIDLQSLNKTVVKGKQYIQKNLMPGNVIDLGATKLLFQWPTHLEWRRAHGIAGEIPSAADIPEKAETEKPDNE